MLKMAEQPNPKLLAVVKPEEIPITKSCKPSGTDVQFHFTHLSAAHRCPETWFNCSCPDGLCSELARASCAGLNAVGVEPSSSCWHSQPRWVPDFYVIQLLQSPAVARWCSDRFPACIEEGFGILKEAHRATVVQAQQTWRLPLVWCGSSSRWPGAFSCCPEDGTRSREYSAHGIVPGFAFCSFINPALPCKNSSLMSVLGYEVESIKVWWKEPNLGVGNGKLWLCASIMWLPCFRHMSKAS